MVVGTFSSRPFPDLFHLDISSGQEVKSFFEGFSPDAVILSGGLTRPDVCELEPELSFKVNVKGTQNVVKYCNCKVILVSTDYVFDGEKGRYSERDKPNPINNYGWTKLKAEEIILDSRDDNVVIRVSGLYGYNGRNNEFLSSFNSGVIRAATDLLGSTLLLDDAVDHLPFFFTAKGIYHLSSGSTISRYDFASMAINILGFSVKMVPQEAKQIYHIAERPKNCSLISVRHSFRIHKENEGLRIVRKYMQQERSGGGA